MSTTPRAVVSSHLSDAEVIEIYTRAVKVIERWKDWTEFYFKVMGTIAFAGVIIIAGYEFYAAIVGSERLTNLNDTTTGIFHGSLFMVGILGLFILHLYVPSVVKIAFNELRTANIVGTRKHTFSVGRSSSIPPTVNLITLIVLRSDDIERTVVTSDDVPTFEVSCALCERFGYPVPRHGTIHFPILPEVSIWIVVTPPGQEERTVVFTCILQLSNFREPLPVGFSFFGDIETWFIGEVKRLIEETDFWSQIKRGEVPQAFRHKLLLHQLARANGGNPIICCFYELTKITADLELTID